MFALIIAPAQYVRLRMRRYSPDLRVVRAIVAKNWVGLSGVGGRAGGGWRLIVGKGQTRPPERQVPAFHIEAWFRVTPPSRRMPPGQQSGHPQARPGLTKSPRFRHRLALFDASSAVRLRSSS